MPPPPRSPTTRPGRSPWRCARPTASGLGRPWAGASRLSRAMLSLSRSCAGCCPPKRFATPGPSCTTRSRQLIPCGSPVGGAAAARALHPRRTSLRSPRNVVQPPVVVRSNYGRPTRPKPDPSPRAPLAGAWDLYAASYALRGDERHAPAYFLAQNDRAALAIAAMGGARSWPDTLEDSKITEVDRAPVALALMTFAAHSNDQALLDLARQD